MIKYLAALLILSGLFLPLSSCNRYVSPSGHRVEYVDPQGRAVFPHTQPPPAQLIPVREAARRGTLSPEIKAIRDYHFFLEGLERNKPTYWIGVLTLAWPALLIAVLHLLRRRPKSRWAYVAAPLLLIWTGYVLQSFAMIFGGRYEAGYWLTLLGIALFGLHAARECLALAPTPKLAPRSPARRGLLALITLLGLAYPLYCLIRGAGLPS